MARDSDEDKDRKRAARAARIATAQYENGWGKPPIKHRFKKGEPQNFLRTKPRRQTVEEIIERLASEKVPAHLNGKASKLSAIEWSLRILRKMVFDGNLKAMQVWFEFVKDVSSTMHHEPDYTSQLKRKIQDMADKYKQRNPEV